MDDTSVILLLTIGTTFLGLVLRYAFKSKCDTINCCYGMLKIHRQVTEENNTFGTGSTEEPNIEMRV